LHQEFLVNDGGAITVSVRQVPLIEDSPGELDRVLGDLVGPGLRTDTAAPTTSFR
jgi:hypothetical protein